MKYIVPVPDITLYEDGFGKFDLLDRRAKGRQLSELVERIDDPLVIAIDGPWGSGKSFFLKCWVGAHSVENEGSAKTVYFDAFENDFLDDPLLSLTSAITDRMGQNGNVGEGWTKVRTAAAKLWRPTTRIALAMATAGASEVVGVVADAALESSKEELDKQVDAFWRKEETRKAAMDGFRTALTEITDTSQETGEQQKLVVVIDELDRCRPDYALSVLEVIKHFFTVPNVHFVLGVNLVELANSVKARYGSETNTQLYLQKFITVTLNLPNSSGQRGQTKDVSLQYFSKMAKQMSLNPQMVDVVKSYLEIGSVRKSHSLRSMERLLTEMALIPQVDQPFEKLYAGYQHVISGLLVLKILFPDTYNLAKTKNLGMTDVRKLFDVPFPIDEDTDHKSTVINYAWASFLKPDEAGPRDGWRGMFDTFGLDNPEQAFEAVLENFLEAVSFGGVPNGQ